MKWPRIEFGLPQPHAGEYSALNEKETDQEYTKIVALQLALGVTIVGFALGYVTISKL
jgi:hypothetical protein